MKFSRVTAAIMMASFATPLLAAAEQVGTLTAASTGTFVARDGKMIPARAGQTLFAGDRVYTRAGANAKVAMSGCSYTLAPTSVLGLGKGNCSISPRSMALQESDEPSTGEESTGTGVGATSVVVAVAAVAAIAAGIYVAVDENDSSPASP